MYIKLETNYNALMNKCKICNKEVDPKCKWIPCKLTQYQQKARKK